jgi:hypothetical protein
MPACRDRRQSPTKVQEASAHLHQPELRGTEQVPVARFPIHVQSHDVGLLQDLFERAALRISARQYFGDIAEDDSHTDRFSKVGKLRPVASVTEDAQHKPADLVAASRGFVPAPAMHLAAGGESAAQQHDDLAEGKFLERLLLCGSLKTAMP